MRIAAGVLLIVAAILNVVGGCTWAGAGACTGCVGEVLDQNRLQEENQWNEGMFRSILLTQSKRRVMRRMGTMPNQMTPPWEKTSDPYEDSTISTLPSQETIEELKTSGAGMALYGFAIMILAGVMIGAAIWRISGEEGQFRFDYRYLVDCCRGDGCFARILYFSGTRCQRYFVQCGPSIQTARNIGGGFLHYRGTLLPSSFLGS